MGKSVDNSKLEGLQELCRKEVGFKIIFINWRNYLKSVRLKCTVKWKVVHIWRNNHMHIHAKSGKGSGMYHKLKMSEQDNSVIKKANLILQCCMQDTAADILLNLVLARH